MASNARLAVVHAHLAAAAEAAAPPASTRAPDIARVLPPATSSCSGYGPAVVTASAVVSSGASAVATSTSATTADGDAIAVMFADPGIAGEAWDRFVALPTWAAREEAVAALLEPQQPNNVVQMSRACAAFEAAYRRRVAPFIRDDFYDTQCSSRGVARWAAAYAARGEISVPLLREDCLPVLARYAEQMEPRGKRRYGTRRLCYPPGEVQALGTADPRRGLVTEVQMTAVARRHLPVDDPVQWIYHSPALRRFLAGVMGTRELHPYLSDLGVAINIMQPVPDSQTALGFHFDSIDSSAQNASAETAQPKGATGVIGIQDCDEGGERVVFPHVGRDAVAAVGAVVRGFDPLAPGAPIAGVSGGPPQVFRGSTRGLLYLFNGGNVLHGVSSVRRGARIAAVFMYQEKPPAATADAAVSADCFYSNGP